LIPWEEQWLQTPYTFHHVNHTIPQVPLRGGHPRVGGGVHGDGAVAHPAGGGTATAAPEPTAQAHGWGPAGGAWQCRLFATTAAAEVSDYWHFCIFNILIININN
jgi:hypothetical protein